MQTWEATLSIVLVQCLVLFDSFQSVWPAESYNQRDDSLDIFYVWDAPINPTNQNGLITQVSPSFSTWEGSRKVIWKLRLDLQGKENRASVYLILLEGQPVTKAFTLSILNTDSKKASTLPTLEHTFEVNGDSWGWYSAETLNDLFDPNGGFKSKNTIKVGVKLLTDPIPIVVPVSEPCPKTECPLCLVCAECPKEQTVREEPDLKPDVAVEPATENELELRVGLVKKLKREQNFTPESTLSPPEHATRRTYSLYRDVKIKVGDETFSAGNILASSPSELVSKISNANKTSTGTSASGG